MLRRPLGGGYHWLQLPLKLALGVGGQWLGIGRAPWRGEGGGASPPSNASLVRPPPTSPSPPTPKHPPTKLRPACAARRLNSRGVAPGVAHDQRWISSTELGRVAAGFPSTFMEHPLCRRALPMHCSPIAFLEALGEGGVVRDREVLEWPYTT